MSKAQTPALVLTSLLILMIVGGLTGSGVLIAPWVFLSVPVAVWLGRRSAGLQIKLIDVEEPTPEVIRDRRA